MNEDLVAPCGLNCGACSGYLAYSRGIPKRRGAISHCKGCRARNKRCAYLKDRCERIASGQFCYTCERFPCTRLQKIDRRYREHYSLSLIENLKRIEEVGLSAFVTGEIARHRCDRCGGIICIHNGKCYDCEVIEHWRRP